LFANTLLNDDFHINDNLANLDTDYSSVLPVNSQNLSENQSLNDNLVSSLEKKLEIIQQEEIKSKSEIDLVLSPMTDFVFNLDTSFNLDSFKVRFFFFELVIFLVTCLSIIRFVFEIGATQLQSEFKHNRTC
jgi:hypothetical protein